MNDVVASVTIFNYELFVDYVNATGDYQLRRSLANDNADLETRYASLGDALRALASLVDDNDDNDDD